MLEKHLKIKLIYGLKNGCRKAIDKNQKRFIKPKDVKPGKIYGMIKTPKESNPERIIASGSLLKNVTSQKF